MPDEAAPPKGNLLVRRPLPAQLVPGAEGAARAGQDDGANCAVALAAGKGLVELPADLEVDGVELLGAVEGDAGDRAGLANVHEHGRAGSHRSLVLSSI